MKRVTVLLIAMAVAGAPAFARAADPPPASAPQALPTAAPDEDLATTARARAEFLALQAGKVDRTRYSKQAADALTDAVIAQVTPQLKAAGDIKYLIYRGKSVSPNKDVQYQYTLVLTNYTGTLLFVLTPDDKIDGINLS
jgi:hypothetical protein